MVEKPKEICQKPSLKKYLITWSLVLAREDLEKMSRRPEVLQKGLKYIKNTTKKNAIKIYRIGSFSARAVEKGQPASCVGESLQLSSDSCVSAIHFCAQFKSRVSSSLALIFSAFMQLKVA